MVQRGCKNSANIMAGGTVSRQYADWYIASDSGLEPARLAFKKARTLFEEQGTADARKKRRLESLNVTSLEDLLGTVDDARQHYGRHQSDSKMRRCMEQVSERIHYYGHIMNVFVQHHPEYVALAWGTMKLLVGAIIEHKKSGSAIANGILDIADSLPRVELASTLYPTDSVKELVAKLYAHIIRFLLRALEWYEEGSLKRAIHSITKPAPLRYNDIIDDIHRVTRQIAAYTIAGSQAEQRDMHHELVAIKQIVQSGNEANCKEQKDLQRTLQAVVHLVSELKIDLHSDQALARSERAQIHRSVSRIHSTQALQVMSTQCSIDHQSVLEVARNLRDRRCSFRVKLSPVWNSPALRAWNRSRTSSLFTIKVPFSDRQSTQVFCTNAIEQLLHARIASFWVLKVHDHSHPVIATLKSLINQAATFISQLPSEMEFAQSLDRFLHAQLEEHYLDVLADLLSKLNVVYIIVQLEAIEMLYSSQFPLCLQQLIDQLTSRGAATVVKILILSWSPGRSLEEISSRCSSPHSQLRARKSSRRRAVRLPNRPLSAT